MPLGLEPFVSQCAIAASKNMSCAQTQPSPTAARARSPLTGATCKDPTAHTPSPPARPPASSAPHPPTYGPT
jgi:hypothetical protein